MPVSPTYPGVYVQEVPSGVRTIVGVSTSITLFVGRTKSGPMNEPIRLTTYGDFVRVFGEDNVVSDMARYLKLFFLNGGTDCYVIRVAEGAGKAGVVLQDESGSPILTLSAKNDGTLGDTIRAAVTYNTQYPEATFAIEIFRWETDSAGNKVKVAREEWTNLSMDPTASTYAVTFLQQKSALVDAAELAAVSAQDGFAISGRPVEDGADEVEFKDNWNEVLGSGADARHKFRISVDGSPFVEVDTQSTSALDVTTLAGATIAAAKDALADALADKILAAFTSRGITIADPPVANTGAVMFPAGPTSGASNATSYLRIQSLLQGDVRIASSPDTNDDLAKFLMLGEVNGGTEVGSHAHRRPAPTGVTLRTTTLADLNAFADLAQDQITRVVLDELDASGSLVATPGVQVAVDLITNTATDARMWNDSGTTLDPNVHYRGLREKLGLIRDAVNTYRANNASKFFWNAEVWGSRLAFIPTRRDDNDITTVFATSPADVASSFNLNVRHYSVGPNATAGFQQNGVAGSNGGAPSSARYDDAYTIADSKIDLFNLLVLPPDSEPAPGATLEDLWPAASVFCQKRRAFLVMDSPPGWDSTQDASTGVDALRVGLVKDFSAMYFPRVQVNENGLRRNLGPAGAMAGLYARIDSSRGVWKAPAGTEADLRGVMGVDVKMSDAENGQINPVGVNAIRLFPNGIVSWGARTMDGSDIFASEYKYVPIRRLALFIEESLYRGLKWVVFEPNDIGLWAQIRLNVGAFMQDLFRKGAFQGSKPSEAYFVKVDEETTTQNDRNLGIVNIWVGFAPLKPAEFVILYLQQMAGQLES
jgi:uncharacterized protein